MSTHRIGTIDDFPPDEGTRVEVDGVEFAVFNVDDCLYGIQNSCPHKRLPLHVVGDERPYSQELREKRGCSTDGADCPDEDGDGDVRGRVNPDGPSINCPWHYLEWDLTTGENALTDTRIATYDIEVRDDDTVWVDL